MYYLAARTGPDKGVSWPVSELGVVIGREPGCDVRVADPLVSRRHCRIRPENGALFLEDLKSSNTTLVNGIPTPEGALHQGDEVAVGNVVFLVVDIPVDGRSAIGSVREVPVEPRTVTLSESEAIYLTEATAMERLGRPQTTRDLAFLFTLGRTLSTATTRAALLDTFTERLRDPFGPRRVWFALRDQVSGVIEYLNAYGPTDDKKSDEIARKLMTAAIDDNRGIVTPSASRTTEGEFSFVMVAPLSIGGEPVGAVAVHGETPERAYDESDLELFIAAAHQAAPFLMTVAQVEQLRRDNERLRHGSAQPQQVGNSPAFQRIVQLMRKAANAELSVLITGETGTGKELAARFIHDNSGRRDGPFVALNCASIPRELLESQLFGHVRGAFTGADRDHVGHLQQADKGTVFLDEIGDLSPASQASILRAIETGSFRRVGAEKETKVDVRIVCATNKPLREHIERGEFRSDLFHRLAGFEVQLPPLRERTADIPLLAKHFFEMYKNKAQNPLIGFTDRAISYLTEYTWPGNIRELRSAIERAVHVCPGDMLDADDLRPAYAVDPAVDEELCSLAAMERRHVERVVRRCEGNISAAARVLGISRNTLYNKLNGPPPA